MSALGQMIEVDGEPLRHNNYNTTTRTNYLLCNKIVREVAAQALSYNEFVHHRQFGLL